MNEHTKTAIIATLGIFASLVVAAGLGAQLGAGTSSDQEAGLLNAKIDLVNSKLADVRGAVDQLATLGVEPHARSDSGTKSPELSNTLLLRFKPGVSQRAMDNVFKNSGVELVDEIGSINVKVLRVPEIARDQVRQALAHNPRVEFVEVNELIAPTYLPNDPEYPNQWHHGVLGSPQAWDIASNTPFVVAVADTGVSASQPDLQGIVLSGTNTVDGTSDTDDIHNHGTWVAGTIAAIGNNALQVAGVAYGVQILPIRISNRTDGYAYFSDMAEAITYAANYGARIANLSFEGACGSAAVQSAAQYMRSKGGLAFAAAGNSNTNPGYQNNAYLTCVSATGNSDSKASFSNYGSYIDLAAPGVGIRTTARSGGTASVSGTSFASPISASVAALIWMSNPTLSADVVEQVLNETAKDLGESGWDTVYGWGRVDAAAAVTLASTLDAPLPDTTKPTVSIGQPQEDAVVSGIIPVQVDASDNDAVDRVTLRVNQTLLDTDSSAPYQFSLDTYALENGDVVLEATAYDTAGNTSVASRTVRIDNVQDDIAPEVRIVSPAHEDSVSSKRAFTISVEANDNVAVTELHILFDGVVRETCLNSSSCSTSINARKETEGAHTITATAYDAAGNVAVAESGVVIGSSSSTSDEETTTKPVKCEPWPSCR